MIKVRLARQGRGHNKFYKIVAIDEKSKRNGQALEIIGYYQPSTKLKSVDAKKIKEWVAKGAQVTKAVEALM